jgi:RNA polymerase sigma-70 factor (ECF subfamily)
MFGRGAVSTEGFDEFCRETYRPALRYALLMTGDPEAAQQAAERAYARAFARWPKVAAEPDRDAWLRRAITREAPPARILDASHGAPVLIALAALPVPERAAVILHGQGRPAIAIAGELETRLVQAERWLADGEAALGRLLGVRVMSSGRSAPALLDLGLLPPAAGGRDDR